MSTTLSHYINPGETLSGIAGVYYRDSSRYQEIASYNGIADPNLIFAHTYITIPNPIYDAYGSPVQTVSPPVTNPVPAGPSTYTDVYGNVYDSQTFELISYGPGQDPNAQPATTTTVMVPVVTTNPVTTTPVVQPAPPSSQYKVVAGDTLGAIAGRFGVTVDAIVQANAQVTNPDYIQAGWVLTIPSNNYYGPGSVGAVGVGSQGTSTTGVTYVAVNFDTQAEADAARAAVAAGGFVGLDPNGAYALTHAMAGVQGITDDIATALMVVESSIGVNTNLTPSIIAIGEQLKAAGGQLEAKVDDVNNYALGDTGGVSGGYTVTGHVNYREVIVRPGDSLGVIASNNGISLDTLLLHNPQFAANPDLIHPGDVVKIPTQQGTTVNTSNPGVTPVNPGTVGQPGVVNQPGPSYSQIAQTLPQLSWGSVGQPVRLLQQALNILNHAGLVEDGDFGPATNTAVHNYQDLNGLVVDGVVGPVTWNHILNGLVATGNTSLANQLAATAGNPGSGPGTGGPTTINNPGVNTGSSGAVNASVDQFMAGIRHVESSGNYAAVGPDTAYGPARGAYQFVQDTWNRAISTYAPQYSNYIGSNVAGVPAHVQDAVARAWFNGLYQRYGSWELVAVAHFAGEGRADDAQRGADVWAISDVLGTSIAGYVQKVLAAMGAAPATNPGVTVINNPGSTGPSGGSTAVGQGTYGSIVGAIQRALNTLIHAGLSVDNDYGPLTAGAVSDYQSMRGLPVTGTVDAQTLSRIISELRGDYFTSQANELESLGTTILGTNPDQTTNTVNPGTVIDGPGGVPGVTLINMPNFWSGNTSGYNAGVQILQQALTALGYPLAADGLFGPLTEQALRDFQDDRGILVSGSTTLNTWTTIATALQTIRPDLVSQIIDLQNSGAPGGTSPGSSGTPGFNVTGSLTVEQFVAFVRDDNLSVFQAEVDRVFDEMSQYLSSPPADVVAAEAAYRIFLRGGIEIPFGTFARVYENVSEYVYVVNHGDSLSGIAAAFGTTVSKIVDATGLTSTVIHPGDILIIERPGTIPNSPGTPTIGVSVESVFSQNLRDLPTATLVAVLKEFFADFADPSAAAVQIATAMTGTLNLSFEAAVQQAHDNGGPYYFQLTSPWLPIVSTAATSAYTWALGQTGSHVTAAKVAHLVGFDGLSRSDALTQAQIPDIPDFEPEGNTTYEKIDHTWAAIVSFSSNAPGGVGSGAILAQMRATLTDLLDQVTNNTTQAAIVEGLLQDDWSAEQAVAIAVVWNGRDATLTADEVRSLVAMDGVRPAFIEAWRSGLSLQQAAAVAFDAAVAADAGVAVPEGVGGAVGETLEVIFHLLQPGVFERLKDAAGDGDDNGIELSDVLVAQNFGGSAGAAARALLSSYEGDQVAWNILDNGKNHDDYINSETFKVDTGGDDDIWLHDVQIARTKLRFWLAIEPVRQGRGWDGFKEHEVAWELSAEDILTVMQHNGDDPEMLALMVALFNGRLENLARDLFPRRSETLLSLIPFYETAANDPDLGFYAAEIVDSPQFKVAKILSGAPVSTNDIAIAALASLQQTSLDQYRGPFFGLGFQEIAPRLQDPDIGFAFISQAINGGPDGTFSLGQALSDLRYEAAGSRTIASLLLNSYLHVTVDRPSQATTWAIEVIQHFNGGWPGEEVGAALYVIAASEGLDLQLNQPSPWGQMLGAARFIADFFFIGDLIDLTNEGLIKPLTGRDPNELIVFLSSIGLWLDFGHLFPGPDPVDVINGLAAGAKAVVRTLDDLSPSLMGKVYDILWAARENYTALKLGLENLISMNKLTQVAAEQLGRSATAVLRIMEMPNKVVEDLVSLARNQSLMFRWLNNDSGAALGGSFSSFLGRNADRGGDIGAATRAARRADVSERLLSVSDELAELVLFSARWDELVDHLDQFPHKVDWVENAFRRGNLSNGEIDDLAAALMKPWDGPMTGAELEALYRATKNLPVHNSLFGRTFNELAEDGYRWNPEGNPPAWKIPTIDGIAIKAVKGPRVRYAEADLRFTPQTRADVDRLTVERNTILETNPPSSGPATKATENLGEAYTKPALQTKWPDSDITELPLGGPANGNFQFDQVFEVRHPNGATEFVVVEAKGISNGTSGNLGTRIIDGQNVQQGTTEYFIDTLERMSVRGEDLAPDLIDAARNGELSYVLSEAGNLSTGSNVSVALSDFIVDADRIGAVTP